LNYRIDLEDIDAVYEVIEKGDIDELLKSDQLLIEKAENRVFEGFTEGLITFPPTYKYQPGTDRYERRPDKKKRMPAWCDRILWIGKRGKQLLYFRAELLASDHKPVASVFEIIAKKLVKEKQQEIYASLVKELDEFENDKIPRVQLTPSRVDVGKVCFNDPVSGTFKITNVGQDVVQFKFISKLNEQDFCKPWLTVDPIRGIIPPGQEQDFSFQVLVTKETASKLVSDKDKLEDILVLELDQGVNVYVEITGEYEKSCFGCQLDFLVRVPTPVRFYQKDNFIENATKILSVPKELWRIIDFIYRRGLGERGLFLTSGDAIEIKAIQAALDMGEEFPPCSIHSMAEVLIKFLENFPKPVYPYSLCSQYSESLNMTSWCKQVT
jgi:phosphatidylinositol-bisphosphatase